MSIRFDICAAQSDTVAAYYTESVAFRSLTVLQEGRKAAMADGPDNSREGQRNEAGKSVESLASEALKVLARNRGVKARVVSEEYVRILRDSVVSPEFEDRRAVVAAMRSNGISVEELIDHYIPEVARVLGEEWCVDKSSFADVTIGASRLQGLLRELLDETIPDNSRPKGHGVAVVVISDEFHTLGALVLTAQLRRLGVSVRLLLDSNPKDVARKVSQYEHFDAIMISASHVETLAQLATFIETLKAKSKKRIPIVVGGPVLEGGTDIRAVTGADFATSDVVEALRLCQLKISPHVGKTVKVG